MKNVFRGLLLVTLCSFLLLSCDSMFKSNEEITNEVAALSGPGNFSGAVYEGMIILTWDPVSDAKSYFLTRKNLSTGVSVALADVDADTFCYKDFDGLEHDIKYEYTISAVSRLSTAARSVTVIQNGVSKVTLTAKVPEEGSKAPVVSDLTLSRLELDENTTESPDNNALRISFTAEPHLVYDGFVKFYDPETGEFLGDCYVEDFSEYYGETIAKERVSFFFYPDDVYDDEYKDYFNSFIKNCRIEVSIGARFAGASSETTSFGDLCEPVVLEESSRALAERIGETFSVQSVGSNVHIFWENSEKLDFKVYKYISETEWDEVEESIAIDSNYLHISNSCLTAGEWNYIDTEYNNSDNAKYVVYLLQMTDKLTGTVQYASACNIGNQGTTGIVVEGISSVAWKEITDVVDRFNLNVGFKVSEDKILGHVPVTVYRAESNEAGAICGNYKEVSTSQTFITNDILTLPTVNEDKEVYYYMYKFVIDGQPVIKALIEFSSGTVVIVSQESNNN